MKNLKVLKYATVTLVTLLFLTVFPQVAYADTGYYTYYVGQGGIYITGYTGDDSDLILPQVIDGQAVVGISNFAFSSSTTLTSAVIPESVTFIGDGAFSNCPNLMNVQFLGDAPSIGELVFNNRSSGFIVYYDPSKNGFSNPWNGFATADYTTMPSMIPVTGITLDKSSVTLVAGDSLSLPVSITPAEAANKNVSWISSDTNVVTVDGSGTINAISEGSAIIIATTEDGGFTATCTVYVTNSPMVPGNELATPQNYDAVLVSWSEVLDADGYEVYRSNTIDGEYVKVAAALQNEFYDSGLKTGTVYFYKVRAYKLVNDTNIYSDYTQIITVKTLDVSIGSTLFLYMSNLDNRNSVYKRAVAIHYGDSSNTCAIIVSEAFRRIGLNIPTTTWRTNQVEDHLVARGWKREMNLNLLQPGDICFTTDRYGNLLGGHSTHVFIFMGWADKEKTLMNISDNQVSRYGSVLHTRTIFRSSMTDATAFFYHADIPSVDMILKLPAAVNANPIAYNKVQMSWNTAAGAYGYKIYRSTSKYGTYSNVATIRNSSYVDPYLTTGRTYYYKVRAYSFIGSSILYGGYSNIFTATPKLSTPSAYANTAYSGKARLSWNGVSGASGYQIYRATSKTGTYSRVTTTSYTSYTNSGLVSGKAYYYKVRAYRNVGNTRVYSNYSYLTLKAR